MSTKDAAGSGDTGSDDVESVEAGKAGAGSGGAGSGGARSDGAGSGGAAARVAGFLLPPLLAEARDPGVVAWRAGLPGIVEDLLAEWSLSVAEPFSPGGSAAWVAPVHRDGDGRDLVLKVAWAHEESRDEALGMAAWQGRGAAEVLHSELRGHTSVLLMEQVRPGTPLAQLLTWPERDEVVTGLLRRMWAPPSELLPVSEAAGLRPLSQMCAWWADEAQGRADRARAEQAQTERAQAEQARARLDETRAHADSRPEHGPPRHDPLLPTELVDHGLALFRSLPREWDGEQVLLATDFHPSNVLARGRGEAQDWVVIDPKPYVGDPHYDLLQHMLNDPDRLVARPGEFADRMAGLTGLDPARARRWLFARCVQESGVMDGAAQAALRLEADGVE